MAKQRTGVKPLVKQERAYMQAVVRLMDETVFNPSIKALQGYDPSAYLAKLTAMKDRIKDTPAYGQPEAEEAIKKIERYQRDKFSKILKSVSVQLEVFSPDADPMVRQMMEIALNTNVDLITNASLDQVASIQNFVGDQIRANPWDLHAQQNEIQGFLEGAGSKKAKNRAKLITRDQNNKLVGSLNEQRHKAVGGQEYRWRSSGDTRVRDSHEGLNGSIQRWDTPPQPDGHPGQGIQCRCIAQFIFRGPGEVAESTTKVTKTLPK